MTKADMVAVKILGFLIVASLALFACEILTEINVRAAFFGCYATALMIAVFMLLGCIVRLK
jgi:hypothetical protein